VGQDLLADPAFHIPILKRFKHKMPSPEYAQNIPRLGMLLQAQHEGMFWACSGLGMLFWAGHVHEMCISYAHLIRALDVLAALVEATLCSEPAPTPERMPGRAASEKATTATGAAPVTHAPALESDEEDNDVGLTTVLWSDVFDDDCDTLMEMKSRAPTLCPPRNQFPLHLIFSPICTLPLTHSYASRTAVNLGKTSVKAR
jgi:hypothetical protein